MTIDLLKNKILSFTEKYGRRHIYSCVYTARDIKRILTLKYQKTENGGKFYYSFNLTFSLVSDSGVILLEDDNVISNLELENTVSVFSNKDPYFYTRIFKKIEDNLGDIITYYKISFEIFKNTVNMKNSYNEIADTGFYTNKFDIPYIVRENDNKSIYTFMDQIVKAIKYEDKILCEMCIQDYSESIRNFEKHEHINILKLQYRKLLQIKEKLDK